MKCVHLKVKLRCPAKGLPHPGIKWFKEDVPIENISRPGSSRDHIRRPFMLKPEKWELKIHGLQKSDHGKYSGGAGSKKSGIE